MKYQGKITDPKDLVTKEYVDTADATKQAKITASGVLIGDGSGGVTAKTLDTSSLSNDNNHVPTSGVVKSALTALETDLASIHATGTTNATGATITKDTYFYLNGTLVQALTDIADGATFTLDTNYAPPSAGSLNALKSELNMLGAGANNAGYHNCIYRGKYLGTSVSAAQQAAIAAGTFEDLFIRDYWTINGIDWVIAHFDYWRKASYTSSFRPHHVVILPADYLLTGKMNSTATTSGGYLGSDFYTGNHDNTSKANMTAIINGAFGAEHLLSYYGYFSNAISNGKASSDIGDWHTVELMSENMVFGSAIYGNQHDIGSDYGQLALYQHDKDATATINRTLWLRTIASASNFVQVGYNMHVTSESANTTSTRGFRPAFAIQYG